MTDPPRVCTVISCGEQKQDLDPGETVPARELYTSAVHTCKDRYGRHSHEYFIASAEFGLVDPDMELPAYDTHLDDLRPREQRRWGREVLNNLIKQLRQRRFDAVVLIGGRTYTETLLDAGRHVSIPAPVFTPWQSLENITGVGRGMQWCTTEGHWPINLSELDPEILGPPALDGRDNGLSRWEGRDREP